MASAPTPAPTPIPAFAPVLSDELDGWVVAVLVLEATMDVALGGIVGVGLGVELELEEVDDAGGGRAEVL